MRTIAQGNMRRAVLEWAAARRSARAPFRPVPNSAHGSTVPRRQLRGLANRLRRWSPNDRSGTGNRNSQWRQLSVAHWNIGNQAGPFPPPNHGTGSHAPDASGAMGGQICTVSTTAGCGGWNRTDAPGTGRRSTNRWNDPAIHRQARPNDADSTMTGCVEPPAVCAAGTRSGGEGGRVTASRKNRAWALRGSVPGQPSTAKHRIAARHGRHVNSAKTPPHIPRSGSHR